VLTLLRLGGPDGCTADSECESLDPNLDAIGWYCGNADDQRHPVA
jgi:hypothetical protein